MRSFSIVLTTINQPTLGIKSILSASKKFDFEVFIIGDKKTPSKYYNTREYISIQDQKKLNFDICKKLPLNSYSRKMIGYLLAAHTGKEFIKETDDDNIPYPSFYDESEKSINLRILESGNKFVNPLNYFSERDIWPRGFPLDEVLKPSVKKTKIKKFRNKFVEQNLAELDPDVDAIFRLTNRVKSSKFFDQGLPILIPISSYAPFNSQCTTWPSNLLPLMYLPVTCSFRMTDIWRSYIAQRLMKDFSARLIYTKAKVKQIRNEHDLMSDFKQEVEGYLRVKEFVGLLDNFKTKKGSDNLSINLKKLYRVLIKNHFFKEEEMIYLDAWLYDVRNI
jgi:hypothetical protein